MKTLFAIATVLVIAGHASAAIQTKPIEYKAGDATLQGYLAWDDVIEGKRPGIIVVHEWWGNNDYPRKRAEQLAQLGYVAFAADMFGKAKITDDPKQAQAWASEVLGNHDVLLERARAAMEVLKQQPNVDPERTAAMGYCFGGAVVLEMARAGMDLGGVVSFHGGLGTKNPFKTGDVKARILVLNGGDDKFVSPQEIEGFKKEMAEAGVDFRIVNYSGAQHAFTNPDADKHGLENVKYNAEADRESWDEMKRFLEETFKK